MQEQYQQSTRQAKPLVIQQIVQIAKSEGARFLRKAPRRDDKTSPENHSWEIVENEFVYQKVSHTLRNQKYQTEQKKKEGLQYSVSSSSPLHQQQHARHPPAQALQPPSISVAAEMAAVPQNLPTVAMGFRPSSSSRAAAPATGTSLDLSGISQLQLQSSFIPQQQPAATPFLQPNTGINNNLASLLIPLLLQMNGGGGSGNTLRVPPPVPIPASSQPHQPLQPFLSTLFSMVSSQQIPPNMIVPLLQAAVMHQQQAVVSSGGGVGGATTSSSSTPTANSTITTPSQQELPLQGNDPQQLNLSSSYDNQEQ